MTENYLQEIEYLNLTITQLKDDNDAMNKFFDKLAIPILKKAVRYIERTLRNFPPEARLFGDDSKLNTFEEVCVMFQEGSLDDFIIVEDTIESICKDYYDNLNPDENFILNHLSIIDYKEAPYILKQEFYDYAKKYSNKRIEYALEHRNKFD